LKAELLAEVRAELAKGGSAGQQSDQPLPGAVLRRGESGGRALQQVLASEGAREAAIEERLDSMARQVEQTDRTVRRNLEEIRADLQRERDVSGKVLSLLLVALVPLVVHLLASLWPRADGEAGQGKGP
jgi:hypothetical protein